MKNNLKFNIQNSTLSYDFGYKPDTDLKDGIAAFMKWCKNFNGEYK